MSNVRILSLRGTKYNMGVEYGKQLNPELIISLNIIKQFFIIENNITFNALNHSADLFYSRYPFGFQRFIQGVANGSELSLDEVKILNGMEPLYALIDGQQEISACSFLNVDGSYTASQANIIGRLYDFFQPYNLLAKYLTVTVLHETDTVPTAFISMPGQIYCPTCINANSLFVELNNGMPSGGFEVNAQRASLLINLLEATQNSASFDQIDKQLSSLNSDFSLVINVADQNNIKSYEYSSFSGNKAYIPPQNSNFASTNFFLNNTWEAPLPTDNSTWIGVSRRDNLLNNANKTVDFSIQDMMNLLDKKITDAGANWDATIYQIAFDTSTQDLYLRITQENNEWTHVNLAGLFNLNEIEIN